MADAAAALLRSRTRSGMGYGKDEGCGDLDHGSGGCCSGAANLSYIVSATLHFRGFEQFWKKASCVGKLASFGDLVIHLCLWISVLAIDGWVSYQDPLGSGDAAMYMREVETAALTSTVVAWVGLLLALVFGLLGQDAGKAYPSTLGFVLGGGLASALFSTVYALLLMGSFPEAAVATAKDDPRTAIRQLTLWAIGLKLLAVSTAKANASFWSLANDPENYAAAICRFLR